MKLTDLPGRTIDSADLIRAEHGRTYDHYLCLTFTDGTKVMMGVYPGGRGLDLGPYQPKPRLEEMQKAPSYFTPQDCADRVLEEETEKRRRIDEERRRDQYELERLARKLRTGNPV